MTSRRRMVVVLIVMIGVQACSSAPVSRSERSEATSSVAVAPTQATQPGTKLSPKPRASTTSSVPPSQPSRLDIGGGHPIHARVLPYGGDVLDPPGGNYHDAFVWTQRGMPGDGARDTTYLFGHTYRGETHGVFDELQNVALGSHIRLITSGVLNYCVTERFTVARTKLASDPRVWARQPLKERGNMLVLIACFLNPDGSPQDKNIVVVASRCG